MRPTLTADAPPVPDAAAPPSRDWLAGAFPEPGTEEWGRMNQHRYWLIDRKVDGVATPEELAELEKLQVRAYEAATRKFPRPPLPELPDFPGWEQP